MFNLWIQEKNGKEKKGILVLAYSFCFPPSPRSSSVAAVLATSSPSRSSCAQRRKCIWRLEDLAQACAHVS